MELVAYVFDTQVLHIVTVDADVMETFSAEPSASTVTTSQI